MRIINQIGEMLTLDTQPQTRVSIAKTFFAEEVVDSGAITNIPRLQIAINEQRDRELLRSSDPKDRFAFLENNQIVKLEQ